MDRNAGRRFHVVAIPYPGRGHINPMLNLCRLISFKQPDFLISFVVTEEWLGLIGCESKPCNVHFVTMPNVIPSELHRGKDTTRFIEAVCTKMEDPFDQLLDRLEMPANVIVADNFVSWAVCVGNRRNIPVAFLWPMSAIVFSLFYNFDLFLKNKHLPLTNPERGEERVGYIPGISSIRLADLPTIIYSKDQLKFNRVLEVMARGRRAQYQLFSSMYELEPQVISAQRQEFTFPTYSIGPLVPHSRLQNHFSSNNGSNLYSEWLDSQPDNSVLYVSFGSFLSVSSAQVDEIAAALRAGSVRYFWVARDESTSRLQETCGEMGMVASWCDQLRVLCHPCIGGFLTHCGWNSIQEGIYAGVPFLTFPITMDQVPNSKLVEEDWKIGWRLNRNAWMMRETEYLVKREEIVSFVQRLMDLQSEEGKEMRKRVKQLQGICRLAIEEGGSSETNLDNFVKDISCVPP
ncbi:UDP-glucuronosyl/UDP-glucosyltransferase [Dillenia turbinata]|uniref:UDP-glucuronosyl/UDP-glucosyltransferase n=1 Tax=Dillenia turbinata TaxID=194707 RepID=A0AAN8V420_9MAGN